MNDRDTTEIASDKATTSIASFGRVKRRIQRKQAEQRYWDLFINASVNDPLNQLTAFMRNAPEGSINSVLSDVHTPEIMSEHVREIARKLGSDLAGIIAIDPGEDVPLEVPKEATFAVICVVPADYDPDSSPGIGGQVPVQKGILVSFVLSAFFRESGYFATMRSGPSIELANLAVRAGLGTLDGRGRLHTKRYGSKVWVADIIYTNFPLAAMN